MTTVVGGGTDNSDGAVATAAKISPHGISFGPDGLLYVADWPGSGANAHRVFRVDLEAPTPVIETVAGAGPECSRFSNGAQCGDGGPALDALLEMPENVRVAPDGTIYLSDRSRRVRRIGTDGFINTIAGEGNGVTDGEPAKAAGVFFNAIDMAVAEDGSLYVTGGARRVYRIDPDGRIFIAAGTGASPSRAQRGITREATQLGIVSTSMILAVAIGLRWRRV